MSSNTRKFPPRAGDLPRADLLKMADKAIDQYGGPRKAQVFFKFTCPECGERCVFDKPNTLFETGICSSCGHEAEVLVGGMLLQAKVS